MDKPETNLFNAPHEVTEAAVKSFDGIIKKTSHFFSTKLATLRMKQSTLHSILPDLLKGYHLAVAHKLLEGAIDERKLKSITDAINLEAQITPMLEVLTALHAYFESLSNKENTPSISVKNFIKSGLSAYFSTQQKDQRIVQFDQDNDFNIAIPLLYMDAMLTQLLDFALHHHNENNDINIIIYFSQQHDTHALHFKITSSHITSSRCSSFFENYLNIQEDQLLPGIAFCRLALLLYGGNLVCNIKEGVHVEFVVTFVPGLKLRHDA